MEPSWVWYAVVGGAGTAVGLILDAVGLMPWWVGTLIGLVGAWAFSWLTALDDVRQPIRSLRVIAGELRWESVEARVREFGIPLYAPPPHWGGGVRLSGGGVSYGPGLLSPARPRATLEWTDGSAVASVTTVTSSALEQRSLAAGRVGFPEGIGHGLVALEDEPALAEVTPDELMARVRPFSVSVDGETCRGSLLDLRPEDLGWLAEIELSDRYRLAIAGVALGPERLELDRRSGVPST